MTSRASGADPPTTSLRATSALNGVKVYEVASSKHNPQFAADGKTNKKPSRKQRKDVNYQQRIELIQDLDSFPTCAHRGKVSEDGQFLVVSGLHPPMFKCFDLASHAIHDLGLLSKLQSGLFIRLTGQFFSQRWSLISQHLL